MSGNEQVVGMALALACALFVWAAIATVQWLECRDRLGSIEQRLPALNPFAPQLGRVVEAKVYEGSKWEPMVVVAVSWHGSVCVRPVVDPYTKSRWIPKQQVPSRVREAYGGEDD